MCHDHQPSTLWKNMKSCEKLSKVVKSFQKLSNVVDSYQKMPKLSKVLKKYHFLLHVFWFANIYPKSHWLRNVAHSTDFAQSTVSGGGLTVECATQHKICKATPDWLRWPQEHKPQKQEIRLFCIVQSTVSPVDFNTVMWLLCQATFVLRCGNTVRAIFQGFTKKL